jgi:hypothetical protein
MWKYGDKIIRPGKGWIDDNGVRHPSNWHIWSTEEKAKYNLKEVIEDRPPDSRLYFWSKDGNGKITSTAKPLNDSEGVVGLKTTLKNEVKKQQGSLLSQTDWAYIRHYDAGIDVPAKIETWRNAIRAKATEMENAIDNSTDTDAVARLFVSWDDEAEANSMNKFREAAAKTLDITILSTKEIEALTPEQKTAYDSDLEKINTEATSKRAIEMKKYPILYVWPELEE